MKKYVALTVAMVGLVVVTFGLPIFAQGEIATATIPQSVVEQKLPTIQPTTIKPLTAEEEATLENKVIKMELAARDLSSEAISEAVKRMTKELMDARAAAYEQLKNELNAYTTEIQKDTPDTVLNRDPKTGKFSRVKK